MSTSTAIQWTDVTDNIIIVEGGGWWCRMISPGCAFCYAAALNQSSFFGGNKLPYSGDPPKLKLRTDIIDGWAKQTKPKRHFVASMTDVFGEWVTQKMANGFLAGMVLAKRQTFQVLTKRPMQAKRLIKEFLRQAHMEQLPPNIWLGVSVEDQKRADERIPILLSIPAMMRFLSVEPMLERIELGRWIYDNTKRTDSLRSGEIRGAGNRFGRSGVEGGCTKGDEREQFNTSDSMREEASGAPFRQLPSSASHDEQKAGPCFGSPSGVAPLLRTNSTRVDSESQRGEHDGQQTSHAGTCDTAGANSPRNQGLENPRLTASIRGEKSSREVDGVGSPTNSIQASDWRAAENNSGGLQGLRQDCQQDMPRSTVGISWIIFGGESGPNARPCHIDWIRDGVRQCRAAGVAPFVKQVGSNTVGSEMDKWVTRIKHPKGGDMAEWPQDIRVREFPA